MTVVDSLHRRRSRDDLRPASATCCCRRCTLATIPLALITRITRAEMLAARTLDHVRTARAKGLPARRVDAAPRAAQRADPDRDGDRAATRAAAVGRGADRDDLLAARPRPADGRCDPVARLSGGAGRRAVHRRRVRAGQSRWSISATRCSTRGSGAHERHRALRSREPVRRARCGGLLRAARRADRARASCCCSCC